ncbi:autophagy-related protein 2 homolog B isoform X3 [Dermacentor albipictus]|uniref:autophagy-related protein 2 homolog B isoform X3 n=1 Tax=Dermacentor albipictus TaxID=60249 RepID=UPI0031FD631E
MPWFDWSEGIKKRACRYLLRRYGSQFLLENIGLDQLTVDLYKGKGRVTNVCLDVKGLNELGEKFNLPVRFVEGYISSIEVAIPWSRPLTDNSVVEVDGLMLTLQPKERIDDASMFEPMLGSMMSSMQLAEEYLKQEPLDAEKEASAAAEPFTGLEQFAQAIETVLCRIKVKLTNTIVRIDHFLEPSSKQGIALELRIASMDYYDEESTEVGEIAGERIAQRVRERFSVSTKRIILNGTSLFTDEFSLSRNPSEVLSNLPAEDNEPQEMLVGCAGASPPLAPPHQEPPPPLIVEPIPICQLMGQQEIKLQLKQDESLEGSGVDIEFSLGQLSFFLRPRQVHLLLQMAKGFTSPSEFVARVATSGNEDLSGSLRGRHYKCTPMEPHHYTMIEQDLQRQLLNQKPRPSRSLGANMGWSTSSSVCLSEPEDEYMPMTNQRAFYESGSVASSDMDSSVTSSIHSSYSKPRKRSKGKRRSSQGYLDDVLVESTHFRVHCSAVCVVILHEDFAGVASGNWHRVPNPASRLSPKAVAMMHSQAETFFRGIAGQNLRDLKAIHSHLPKICRSDHLWINGTPVTLEGTQGSSSSQWSLSFQLSVVEMEVAECLFNRRSNIEGDTGSLQDADVTDILSLFESDDTCKKPSEAEPFLRLKYEYPKILPQTRTSREQTTGITLELLPAQIELDRSLEDRIHALLYPPPHFSSTSEQKNDIWSMSVNQDNQGSSPTVARTSITVRSPFIKANLRFPIPDMRPLQEVLREPWWQKNLRPDILSVELLEPTLSTTLVADENEDLKLVLVCKEAHLFYKESQLSKPVPFARVFRDPSVKEEDFDLPSLRISISPSNEPSPLETELCEESMMPSVMFETLRMPQQNDAGSPFTVHCLCYDNNEISPPRTTRLQEQQQRQEAKENAESDKLVQPGDKATLRSFIDKAASNCRIQLEFLLPSLEVTMPDKRFYELIYNRLTMDLVLWEPVVTRLRASGDSSLVAPGGDGAAFFPEIRVPGHLAQQSSVFQEFHMCRSGNLLESDTESDDGPPMFHSVYDNQRRSTIRLDRSHLQSRVVPCRSWQTQLVINIHITDGAATLKTPLQDAEGRVMPKYHGNLRVSVKDAQLFVSSSHHGDPDLNYVIFNAGTATLHHQGQACSQWECTLLPVLYRSGDGLASMKPPSFLGSEVETADMFSLVIETRADPSQGVKTIKVAVGVSDTTLRHRMAPLRRSWVKQFVDFFDVVDEEVLGYQPLGVVTEFHLTLSSCAIDYRPLHIPYQTLVSLESFSISSNITANTTTSQLRIIAEEVFLYISDKVSKDDPPDLSNGYVCVADTDLFDISARTTDVPGQRVSIKMKASNNITNLRTCVDSCQALQALLTYLASDGDLVGNPSPPPEPSSCGGGGSGPVLVEHLGSVTGMMADHFQTLVAEAMRESSSSSSSSQGPNTEDDSPASFIQAENEDDSDDAFRDARCDDEFRHDADNLRNVRRDVDFSPVAHVNEVDNLRTSTTSSRSRAESNRTSAIESSYSDEEFCILEDDPGVGILPRSGEPQIRVLVSEPLEIHENYFSTSARNTDQLRAPRNFPEPVQKYTLREMTLVWHMYGGCDFESSITPNASRPAEKSTGHWDDGAEECYANVVLEPVIGNASYSRDGPPAIELLPFKPQSPPQTPRHRRARKGGPGRCEDVLMELHMNKIRFQHEVYPEDTYYASRQVLLIQDVEVCDRLASSRINKFLYQYASEAKPRQSHANMVSVKCVRVRPDLKAPCTEECEIRVSIKPLRINADQDAVLFLVQFFTGLSSNPPVSPSSPRADSPELATLRAVDVRHASASAANSLTSADPERHVAFASDDPCPPECIISPTSSSSNSIPMPMYIRSFVFTPDVPIRIDYHGKRVLMEQGALAGLLMGLGQLNCLEITLKKLQTRQGLLGFDKLVAFAINEWLNDIKKNQVPSVLGGVGPMHSFVQLFSGLRDLVWMPVEQYRRDGRIVRGLQRGANSFTISTAMACLELTNKVVQTVQGVAELAYDMLSPGPSMLVESHNRRHRTVPNNLPVDIREGVNNAYQVVTEGLGDTARTLVKAASQEHRQKGVSGAVGGLLRQIPPTMAAGIIVATEATSTVLGGVRNQIQPDARREDIQKWRQRLPPKPTGATATASASALAAASR